MDKNAKARVKRLNKKIKEMEADLKSAGVDINPPAPEVAPKGNPMLQRIATAMHRTWQAIAQDAIMSLNDGKPMTRSEAYELIADRMYLYGKDEEARAYWFNQTPKARQQWLPIVLPHERYGA